MRRSRDIVAANVNALMASDKFKNTLGVPRQVILASGGTVTNGTLGRVRNAENGTRLDTVDAIAAVFGLESWQLLVPDLDAAILPTLTNAALLTEIRALVLRESPTQDSARVTDELKTQPSGSGTTSPRVRLPASVEDRTVVGGSNASGRSGAVPEKRRRGGPRRASGGR